MVKKANLSKLSRAFTTQVRALEPSSDGNSQLYEISVSSETPYMRYMFGEYANEVLSHAPDAVDLSRADGMPLLLEHDPARQIGVVESIGITDGRLVATVRFSKGSEGAEVERDVADRIRRNVSVGYMVREYEYQGLDADGVASYVATDWMPMEVSIVSVPADPTIGVGRAGDESFAVTIRAKGEDDEEQADQAADAGTASDAPASTADAQASEAPAQADGDAPADAKAEAPADDEAPTDEAPSAIAAEAAETLPDAESPAEDAAEAAPAESGTDSESAASQAQEDDEEEQTRAASSISVRSNSDESLAIVQLAQRHGKADLAADFLQRGLTVAQASQELLKLTRSNPINSHEKTTQMSNKDLKKFSYARAIMLAAGEVQGGVEAEVSQEVQRSLPTGYKSGGGIFIPTSLTALGRAMDSQTPGAGKETVFTAAGDLIDLLYNKTVVKELGATTLSGLNGPVLFPKITGGTTAHWVAENPGIDVESSQMITGSVSLTPKTLQATTAFSRQLLVQSSFDVESRVMSDMATQHALAIDKAALHGTGLNNQPTGIYNASGVQTVDMSSGVDYGKLIDMVAKVLAANALTGSTGFATTPLMAAKLAKTLVAQAAGAGFVWTGKLDIGELVGYAALSSNQVAANLGAQSNEHGIVFGNFNDLVIGSWGAIEIQANPYTYSKQGLIEVTSNQIADIAILRGESFVKAIGAKL